VMTISGLRNLGLDELWGQVTRHRDIMANAGEFAARRERQQVKWFWAIIEDRLFLTLRQHEGLKSLVERLEADVRATRMTPTAAARAILDRISFT